MTNFDKVRNYYKSFDEQNRLLSSNSGRLEFETTMEILKKYLPEKATVLDLGGGAGAYSFPLAAEGYEVYLADLSEELIGKAKEYGRTQDACPIAYDVRNATNLGAYKDEQFDVVILLGPLYHLLEESERKQCVSEIRRVLKRSKGRRYRQILRAVYPGYRSFIFRDRAKTRDFKDQACKASGASQTGYEHVRYNHHRE